MESTITSNSVYAPGLTTYTTTSEHGAPGKRGNSMHYANLDLSYDQNINYVSELISSGLPLNDVAKISESIELYAEGDYVIDSTGNVYRIAENGGKLGISSGTKEGKLSDARKHYKISTSDTISSIDKGYILFATNASLQVISDRLAEESDLSSASYIQQIEEATGIVTYFKK